jgi:NifU-like protein involved in Fe-S cluster formation
MAAYNETVTDHFAHPRGVGAIENADLVGRCGAPGQGHWLTLYLRLEGDAIAEARFQTYGCPAVIAAGSMLVEMVTGAGLQAARAISAERIAERLGGLPLGKEHAPGIAAEALRDALANHSTGR